MTSCLTTMSSGVDPFPLTYKNDNFNKLPNPKKQILSCDRWDFQRTWASAIYITSSQSQAKVMLKYAGTNRMFSVQYGKHILKS